MLRFARFLVPSLMISVLPIASAPAWAEVVASTDADFVTRAEADVPAGPFAVWSALIAPAKWWNAEHTWSGKSANLYIDSQATGCFCELLSVPDGAPEGTRRGSVEHFHIIAVMPGKLLRMTGGLGPLQADPVRALLSISLNPGERGGTRITFEYKVVGLMTLKGGEIAPAVDKVLSEQLGSLATLLGAKSPPASGPLTQD